MKLVIIGRTGTGKTTLANELRNQGLNILKTCTTRAPRNTEDAKQYYFLTQKEADAIPAQQKVLRTTAPGYEYFALKEDLKDMDACILDPSGYREIVDMFPDIIFNIVHVKTGDSAMQKKMAVERMPNKTEGEKAFEKRMRAEDAIFSAFEKEMAEGKYQENSIVFENDYDMQHLKNFSKYLLNTLK